MVFIPTITTLRRTLEFKKYRVYDREDGFDLNIVGIRTHGRKPGRFDDFITVFYRSNGEWILNVFPATTDPGGYWLDHPQSPLGTAILKEGQYLRSYQIGKHKNRYRALVQRAEVTVIRDFDRDGELDFESGREETGFFGINIHRASLRNRSIDVGKWSAGCQVIADPRQFDLFMDLCDEGSRAWGNAFTYTLLHQRDFEAATLAEPVVARGLADLPMPPILPLPDPPSPSIVV